MVNKNSIFDIKKELYNGGLFIDYVNEYATKTIIIDNTSLIIDYIDIPYIAEIEPLLKSTGIAENGIFKHNDRYYIYIDGLEVYCGKDVNSIYRIIELDLRTLELISSLDFKLLFNMQMILFDKFHSLLHNDVTNEYTLYEIPLDRINASQIEGYYLNSKYIDINSCVNFYNYKCSTYGNNFMSHLSKEREMLIRESKINNILRHV